jgi:hypothetical protein
MKLHWTDLAIVTVLVGVGCTAIYVGLIRALRQVVAERQRETERRLNALNTTVKALQARVAELGLLQVANPQDGDFALLALAEKDSCQKKEPLKPEIVAALTAAATTFLGKKTRIRSAQQIVDGSAGAWAQQGRVIVQTSHNLRTNG